MVFLLNNVPKPIITIPRRSIWNGPWVILVVIINIVEKSTFISAKTDRKASKKPAKMNIKDPFIIHLHFHVRTGSLSNKIIV